MSLKPSDFNRTTICLNWYNDHRNDWYNISEMGVTITTETAREMRVKELSMK